MRIDNVKKYAAKGYQIVSFGLLGIIVFGVICVSGVTLLGTFALAPEVAQTDYSMIYDEEYYLASNPDIVLDTYIEDENVDDPVLAHFLNEGMAEGRIASPNFDVIYYRELYPDLNNVFGDDWKSYYMHYIETGIHEGRIAVTSDNVRGGFALGLTCEAKDNTVVLNINQNVDFLEATKIYVFQLYSYEDEISDDNLVKIVNKNTTQVEIELRNITDKYILAIVGEEGYEIISNIAYINNPESLCKNEVKETINNSKKGIAISNEDDYDKAISDLRLSHVQYDFVLQDLLSKTSSSDASISFKYNGEKYYFSKAEVRKLDELLAKCAEENVVVTARILSEYDKDFADLYYNDVTPNRSTKYYAINTSEKSGAETLEAFVAFFSERYNGTDEEGRIVSNWILGNNVNDNSTMNYMGEADIYTYVEEYARTFRLLYNVVKMHNANANVYMPISNEWNAESNKLFYSGRDFFNAFNDEIVIEGALDWGLCCEAQSYPSNDPLVDNDDIVTLDENGNAINIANVASKVITTNKVSMKNIDVITRYLHRRPFLNPNGEVRSVIISGIGYTSESNIFGDCEALQASSIMYSYYKAEMNEDIDAYIYGYLNDNGRTKYTFGIDDKHAYEVFSVMDSKNAMQDLAYMCEIYDIENWKDIIPYFDEAKFVSFTEVVKNEEPIVVPEDTESEDEDETAEVIGPFNLSSAQIQSIEDCKYTGKECKPKVVVTIGDKILVEDVDYDLVYVNNINAGEAKVVIIGLNDCYGYVISHFEIVEEK